MMMTDPGKKIQLPGIIFLKQFSHVFMQTGSGLARKAACVKIWTERQVMSKNELQSSGEHRRCDFANGASELYVKTGMRKLKK